MLDAAGRRNDYDIEYTCSIKFNSRTYTWSLKVGNVEKFWILRDSEATDMK